MKFGMTSELKAIVPMTFRTKLTRSLDKHTPYLTSYRQVIRSLLYLTSSSPDIMLEVFYCNRYQANPREPHMTTLKNIFRYLKKNTSHGLWYPTNSTFFVQDYSDKDLSGCGLDRKSTIGGCKFLDGKFVSWKLEKQIYISLPIAGVEYKTYVSCTSQINCRS